MLLSSLLCCIPHAKHSNSHDTQVSSTSSRTKSTNTLESEVYSAQRATSLFDTYAEPDDPASIGAEGFERLCSDMNVSLEGALPLLLAWQMKASEMAKISRSEWDTATGELQYVFPSYPRILVGPSSRASIATESLICK